MLFTCKPGCPGKRGTTEGLLDLEQDEVVCTYCGIILKVSKFTKNMMKQGGKILRKAKKAFQFRCETCKRTVDTEVVRGKLTGRGCNKDCKFNVGKYTIYSLKNIQESEGEIDE